jgi:hypothetical protein
MSFDLNFTIQAKAVLDELEQNLAFTKRLKAVRKALTFLESNPRHPDLNTHEFTSMSSPTGEGIFEVYAEK